MRCQIAFVRGRRLSAAVHDGPLFVGGTLKGLVDAMAACKRRKIEESELGPGNLFATGLVAGGAVAGVVAMLNAKDS